MKLPRWLVPWRKHTDQNQVTPITEPYRVASRFGFITEAFGGMWQRNLVLDDTRSILAFSAVYACVSLISGDIAKLRAKLMRLRDDGVWEEFANTAFSPVLRKPNRYQTWLQFIEQWVLSKLIYGNTYVLKERDARKVVVAMYVLDPSRVTPLIAPDGEVLYRINEDWLAGVKLDAIAAPRSEVIHDRHKTLFHPLVGVSPIYSCALSTTQGRRIQLNASKFFENMSRPSGMLTAPHHIPDDLAKRLKEEFESNFSGDNIGRMLVGGDGLEYKAFTMPAEQSQLIEQLRWTTEDVARAFQVPLYKIAAGQLPNFNNVGALNQEYYQQTLQPYIEAIEALLDEGLGLDPRQGVELDVEGLLRMDPKTRAEANEIEVRSAIKTPNEARKAENRPPMKGGDALYLQQQNFSLEALAKRDAKDDPFATEAPASAPAANDDEVPDDEADEGLKSYEKAIA